MGFISSLMDVIFGKFEEVAWIGIGDKGEGGLETNVGTWVGWLDQPLDFAGCREYENKTVTIAV